MFLVSLRTVLLVSERTTARLLSLEITSSETARANTALSISTVSALEVLQPESCPLADHSLSVFPWVRVASWAGVPGLERFTHIKAWLERMEAREAVKAGLDVPEKNTFDPNATQEELDAKAKEASKWIMKGQEEKK